MRPALGPKFWGWSDRALHPGEENKGLGRIVCKASEQTSERSVQIRVRRSQESRVPSAYPRQSWAPHTQLASVLGNPSWSPTGTQTSPASCESLRPHL